MPGGTQHCVPCRAMCLSLFSMVDGTVWLEGMGVCVCGVNALSVSPFACDDD